MHTFTHLNSEIELQEKGGIHLYYVICIRTYEHLPLRLRVSFVIVLILNCTNYTQLTCENIYVKLVTEINNIL